MGTIVLLSVKCNESAAPEDKAAPEIDQLSAIQTEDGFDKVRSLLEPTTTPLTTEESVKTFRVPKGYHMELVASEPLISEPSAITWDGNGRLFVAQMETYMQTVEGKNQYEPHSRVMLLEDTDNDGRMDKSTAFIDNLVSPRMIICIGDELLVNETNSFNIYAYKDTNNDGRADKKRVVFETNQQAFGNIEHQRSGLDWNLDNWMYVTTDPVRYKYKNGQLKVDSLVYGNNGQWGITHDDLGRIYFSRGGALVPVCGFNINPVYGQLEIADRYNDSIFNEVWPIIKTPDTGSPLRSDSTLKIFTAACGQSIFRGDRLPKDLRGDYLVAEPVGRLIRRANVFEKNGIRQLKNCYEKDEFITSTDMNFRPVNTYTGPDGCLYIVDMYRGIIQEATWAQPGSTVYSQIKSKNLDRNIKRGRIYRLVHDDFKPGPRSNLLREPTLKLISYLAHPNGWWRDNAQKEIIRRGEKSAIPALKEIIFNKTNVLPATFSAIARLHALWTLEGLDGLEKEFVLDVLNDKNVQIRIAAIRLCEPYVKRDDSEVIDRLRTMKDDESGDLKAQLLLTLHFSKSEQAQSTVDFIRDQNSGNRLFVELHKTLVKNEETKKFGATIASLNEVERELVLKGAGIFKTTCVSCHGPDGQGLLSGVAPPLISKFKLIAKRDGVIKILLHGLKGPVDGRSYTDPMPGMGFNDDEWIASVLSYVRYDLCMKSFPRMPESYIDMVMVKPGQVKAVRDANRNRDKAWTWVELEEEEKRLREQAAKK